ncbi:MAG: hypothetical protein QM757_40440 [Paludibaculum sp.]
MKFEKPNVTREAGVLFAEIAAPPMNLPGPQLFGDLVALLQQAEADEAIQEIVFRGADQEYFISHVDVKRINEYRDQGFVAGLAYRIARFPAAGNQVVNVRANAVTLASADEFTRDGTLFCEGVRNREAQSIIQPAMKNGLQTRAGELTLATILGRD